MPVQAPPTEEASSDDEDLEEGTSGQAIDLPDERGEALIVPPGY